MKSRERSIKDISMACSFISSSLSPTVSQVEDRQTDIRHRYYKKLLFKSNNKPNNKTTKNLFSQNAHSMVALLVAIAVVFVSRFFSVLIDLDLDLSPSPPLPLTHVHTQTNFTY